MILIVDDDPSVLASLALLLRQAGYRTHGVASPAEALAWLERESCDLVVQDMNFSRQTTGEEGSLSHLPCAFHQNDAVLPRQGVEKIFISGPRYVIGRLQRDGASRGFK